VIPLAALLRAREGLPDIAASSASVSGAVAAAMPVAMTATAAGILP
jgi:hypothetical protein